MKQKYNSIVRLFAVAAIAAGSFGFQACEDDPDKYEVAGGSPEIIFVRKTTNPDSLITAASMGERIALVGNNLRSITRLFFNDREAVLNSSLITDHALITSVPRDLANNPTDLIYMINSAGDTTTYPFSVVVPGPILANMDLEMVKPGEVAAINGDYLLDYEEAPMTIKMPDGQVVSDFVSTSKTRVEFVVPDGCTQAGPVVVTTKYGSTKSTRFEFNDDRGIMFEFDGVTGLGNHGWHARDIISDATSISGNFVQLGNGTAVMSKDGGWNDGDFAFEYWCGSWDNPQNVTSGEGIALNNLVDFKDFANMALKFEMYIPSSNPWSAGAMQIAFEGYDKVTLSGNPIDGYDGTVAGANAFVFNGDNGMGTWGRAMYRPWEATGSFHTDDKWITVTIPLANFTYDREGAATDNVATSAADFASLTMFVVGGGVEGVECNPIIKLDNIRAVPFK